MNIFNSILSANIVIAAKTSEPHPKLPGTIYTAADEVEAVGGKALPLICDIRDDNSGKCSKSQFSFFFNKKKQFHAKTQIHPNKHHDLVSGAK